MEQASGGSASVNRGQRKFERYKTREKKKGACYACGREGHYRKDPNCPAKGKICNKCHKEGHFAQCCQTKNAKEKTADRKSGKKKLYVRLVDSDDEKINTTESKAYLFAIGENEVDTRDNEIIVNIGGIDTHVLVDSEASVNVIDRELWESLRAENIQCDTHLCLRKPDSANSSRLF